MTSSWTLPVPQKRTDSFFMGDPWRGFAERVPTSDNRVRHRLDRHCVVSGLFIPSMRESSDDVCGRIPVSRSLTHGIAPATSSMAAVISREPAEQRWYFSLNWLIARRSMSSVAAATDPM